MQSVPITTDVVDRISQWLSTGRWFYSGSLVSSTNKTDRYDINKKWLKVALNTINPNLFVSLWGLLRIYKLLYICKWPLRLGMLKYRYRSYQILLIRNNSHIRKLLFFYMYILITVVIMGFVTEVSDKYEGLSIDCWNTVVCQSTFYFPLGTSNNLIWTIPIFQHSESKWSLTYIPYLSDTSVTKPIMTTVISMYI
jgi:hypothetical protein